MTGLPEMVGLVRVLLVRVWVASTMTTVPVVLGRVIVLSWVGSTTVRIVSWASAVAPSKDMLAAASGVPVKVGLEIVGLVRVLAVRVCALSVPTTSPSPEPIPCIDWALPAPSL
jgi:hypothetical protein